MITFYKVYEIDPDGEYVVGYYKNKENAMKRWKNEIEELYDFYNENVEVVDSTTLYNVSNHSAIGVSEVHFED